MTTLQKGESAPQRKGKPAEMNRSLLGVARWTVAKYAPDCHVPWSAISFSEF